MLTVFMIYIASLVAQMVKNLPIMQEMRAQSLHQEDPLEKGMATHSSIFAWEIPWTEEPGRLLFMGLQKSQTKLSTRVCTMPRIQQETKSLPSRSLHFSWGETASK